MNTDIWFLLDFHDCLHAVYMVPLPLELATRHLTFDLTTTSRGEIGW